MAQAVPTKGTGKFIRQGQTTDGLYGCGPDPKSTDGVDGDVRDLKP